ncbi:MAG: N-acetylglucosamine-6-phosphate deacetylase [Planctomycetes bacterium]|nr:N-acetylglucosamine-6-phosphate deacetylase [Planctomycetota bacterium]
MTVIIQGAQVLLGPCGEPRPVADILIRDRRIVAITPPGNPHPADAQRIDGEGLVAAPGFIDLHVHGGMGADFMDATEEAFATIGAYHAGGGTTAYMPTTCTEPLPSIVSTLDMAARCREQRIGGVGILGVHIEGPYFAPTKAGCHVLQYVRVPTAAENRVYLDRAPIIARMTMAPEVPGVLDFLRDAARKGIIASGGHSEATLDETARAVDQGMTMITHLYCAMSSILKRGPHRIGGMLEATLLDDRLATELIADLRHVNVDLMRLALKTKAGSAVCLVTDAMRGAGMPDGDYFVGSRIGAQVVVENGIARNRANTGFASSTVRMIDLVRNAVAALGLDLAAAVRRASLIPATIAGIADRKGSIEVGKDADIVLLAETPRLEVRLTMVGGEVIHRA